MQETVCIHTASAVLRQRKLEEHEEVDSVLELAVCNMQRFASEQGYLILFEVLMKTHVFTYI